MAYDPGQTAPRHLIDPVAFFVALIGGPVLFTLATFWLLFIPVFALGFGGIPYLLIGTPVLLVYLRHRPASAAAIAVLALGCFAFAWLLLMIVGAMTGLPPQFGLWLAVFGAIFAPCWGASFGWLYRYLARDFFTHSHLPRKG